MNILPDDAWSRLLPELKRACPRLTESDLQEADRRIDLLIAKIQNRHWISRVEAKRLVLAALARTGTDLVNA